MRLLEIIPTPDTDPEVTAFFMHYGDVHLGKQTVLCKDTPAFIANRVGVYAMAKIFQLTHEIGLDIATVDTLTGPAIGRPKTGTFRLADLVGMDTAVHVINGMRQNCPDDEQVKAFEIPRFLQFLIENKFFGNKSGKGFYQKTNEKDAKGRPVVLALNLETLEYGPSQKEKLPVLDTLKQIDELPRRMKALFLQPGTGNQRYVVCYRRRPARRFCLGKRPLRILGYGRRSRRRTSRGSAW